jgi:hypothetical protein
VRLFYRDGVLGPGRNFNTSWTRNGETVATVRVSVGYDCVVFSYRQSWRGGPWRDCTNTILLTWTECHYGGKRPWWQCPGCDRRVALLYSGDGWYACRHCRNLAYRSQRETEEDLASRRANRIRDRLGWPRGILNMPGGKPKGMHWTTYLRLVDQHTRHSNEALAGVGQYLARMRNRLDSFK